MNAGISVAADFFRNGPCYGGCTGATCPNDSILGVRAFDGSMPWLMANQSFSPVAPCDGDDGDGDGSKEQPDI